MDVDMGQRKLSKTKNAEWLFNGDLCISRRKVKEDGSLETYAYEIYVTSAACRKIIQKKTEIPQVMSHVRTGKLPNPSNVELASPRILQVSVFNGAPKFGIHKIDQNGRIVRCAGLNLTPTEFKELLKFFEEFPPVEEEEETCNNFEVDSYKWSWKPIADNYTPTYADGLEYVCPEACLLTAEEARPLLGNHKLEISCQKKKLKICNELVDAAVAKIIVHNYNVQETLIAMENPYSNEKWMEMSIFAPGNLGSITTREVFALCLRAINQSDKSTSEQVMCLMKTVMQRGKHSDAVQLIDIEYNNQPYVDLFKNIIL